MKLLAFDTSTDACAVGIACEGDIDAERLVEARAHTRVLMPMITRLLEARGLEVADLDAIVPGNGPGSFIGVRIGASVAQGLAFGAGLPVVPVSSLAVLAAEVFSAGADERVLVAQDARMGEVYLAAYLRDDEGMPVAEGEPILHPVGDPVRVPCGTALAGSGWRRHPQLLAGHERPAPAIIVPDARFLLAIGRRDLVAGRGIPPESLEPEYLRQTVAVVPDSPRAPGT